MLYQFDDPALESLSAGQKILLRMGSVNERRVKAKLAELRTLLTDAGRNRVVSVPGLPVPADSPAPYPRLLGDVGGTRARFAWVAAAGAGIADVDTRACAEFDGLEAAIESYLARHRRPRPRALALGIATSVHDDIVTMTNRAWSFSIDGLRRGLGLDRLVVLNDFAMLALALPTLDAASLLPVGGSTAIEDAPLALLGAGTGLGVSGLLTVGGVHLPITGEGGHASLSASRRRPKTGCWRSCANATATSRPSGCSREKASSTCTAPGASSSGSPRSRCRPRRLPRGPSAAPTRCAVRHWRISSPSSAASPATSR